MSCQKGFSRCAFFVRSYTELIRSFFDDKNSIFSGGVFYKLYGYKFPAINKGYWRLLCWNIRKKCIMKNALFAHPKLGNGGKKGR